MVALAGASPISCRCQCWVGPHHSAVITGIARAGINALIELAGGKQPRGRPVGLLCDNPQVQDAVGRADAILNAGRAYRSAMIAELWNTVAAGKETTLEQRARCRLASTYAADCAREAMDLVYRHGGSTSFKRDSRLAECWRDLHVVGQTVTIAPEWYPIGGRVYLGIDPARACASPPAPRNNHRLGGPLGEQWWLRVENQQFNSSRSSGREAPKADP